MILYNPDTKRLYMATQQDLLAMRIDDVNKIMKPNPPYTEKTFRLSNHWLLFQADLVEYMRQGMMITAFERLIIENINQNVADIRLDGPGSYIKIKTDLEAIEEVEEVGLGSPVIFNDRALYGVAIKYKEGFGMDSIEVNQKIANALALATGVGIYTKQDTETQEYFGTLANGQPWAVYWRLMVDKPISLRYEFNLEFGKIKLDDEDLKKILVSVIDESFKIGSIFQPQKYAGHFAFNQFDRKKLLWKVAGSTDEYSSLNILSNYYEKWIFEDILFDNVGNVDG